MTRSSVWFIGLFCAVSAILSLSTPTMAASAGNPEPTPALGTITIATGPDSSVDGYLEINPDDYGAWSSVSFGGAGDLFNPSGDSLLEASFTSGFFVEMTT